ncbi:MAG: phosphatidate cytidylyltransferase, partial [Anaerolineae bacterium]|nr:phosphatidate cytidylyltransferase [Anaerolineae bacterium]
GVKDSHAPGYNILPGHGGVLDRFDAALWIITLYYVYLVASGNIPLLW